VKQLEVDASLYLLYVVVLYNLEVDEDCGDERAVFRGRCFVGSQLEEKR
jgi:hypothetical protein